MTYPEDMLDGLDPTPEERLAFYRALDEVEAAEDAGYDDGPWDDQADRLATIGETLDDTYARNATRIGEDIVAEIERRPSDEARLARAMPRIAAGTYTEPGQLRPARDAGGRYASACGPLDDLGMCGSRYHDPRCGTAVASAAAAGGVEAVEAWNDTLDSHPTALDVAVAEQQLGLANEPGPGDGTDLWSDLLHSGEPGPDTDLRARLLHSMGETDAPPPLPRADLPEVSGFRSALGI